MADEIQSTVVAQSVGMREALEDLWALTSSFSQYTLEHFARKVRSRVDAALASQPSPAATVETLTPAEAWSELVEKDDRTSPEDYPEMALITEKELRGFMQRGAVKSKVLDPTDEFYYEGYEQARSDLTAHPRSSAATGDAVERLAEKLQQHWQGGGHAYTRPWDNGTDKDCVHGLPGQADFFRQLARIAVEPQGVLVAALQECIDTLALVEHPQRVDPHHGEEIKRLGDRIGYGALMSSASASWREKLAEDGYPVGGAFVAGPCHGSVVAVLKKARAALALTRPNCGSQGALK